MSSPVPGARSSSAASGVAFALSAYLLWGFLPLYFLLLSSIGPWEIVAWRIVFSLVFCAVLLSVTRGWRRFAAIVRSPKTLFALAGAGALIYVNWQTFVIAALSDHVVETALGYFINPIVTVVLGATVLRERLRPAQWVAIGICALAVLVIAIGYGSFPWMALTLAFSFGFYGLVKRTIASRVDAISGLAVETAWLIPVAILQILIISAVAGLAFPSQDAGTNLLVCGLGVVTATPLLLFAASSRRIPLVVQGFAQFVNPLIMFLVGVFILGEPMPLERLIGFALVWLGIVVLCTDMYLHRRTARPIPTDLE